MYKFKIIANEQTPKATGICVFPEDIKMMEKFLSFARRQYNCVGLASNQVSLDGERIMKPFFAIKVGHFWDIIITPNIVDYFGEPVSVEEGCLTWIGKKIQAERYNLLNVEYYSLKGEFIKRPVKDFEAHIWQHEYNHLMGIEEIII